MSSVYVPAVLILVISVTGGLMAAMPWLEPRGQCFAVTVPASAAKDPRLEAARRAYAHKITALMIACGAMVGLATAMDATGLTTGITAVAALMVTTVALVAVPFVLMLHARQKVQGLKEAEGWHAGHHLRVAAIGETDLPRPLPVAFELLHVPLALLALGLGSALMPSMSDRIAIHFDAVGNANGWIERGPVVLALPLVVIALIAVTMTGCHLAIVLSKKPGDPSAPATSAFCYATFARANSRLLLLTGLGLNLLFALMPLQFAGIMSIDTWITALLVVVAIAVIGSLWIALVYGQNGSRAMTRLMGNATADDASIPADDDARWLAGVFYANAKDPALVVPKRFGVGWTLNWARPASWGIVAGSIVLVVVFCIVASMLV